MVTRANSPTEPTIALGYARVSTREQSDSGLGLEAQRAAIEHECARRGWQLERVTHDVSSGKSTNGRHALAETLAELDAGKANVLVVSKLDRLARSTIDFATIVERAQRRGWSVVALDLNIDTTTATGRMFVGMLALLAQWEREIIGERTSDALQAKKAEGVRLGRPVLLPVAVRRRIADERRKGGSLAGIARGLNKDGVPTAHGGEAWHAATVKAVLASVALDWLIEDSAKS